ncbi:MAG: NUDIX domain-containing protein [Pseudomonadota bacterium]
MTNWRPPQRLRVLAVGLPFRGEGAGRELLASPVRDDQGALIGWRPIGGEVEFGETAEAALQREFLEEFALRIRPGAQICALENLFEHHGAPGHEIILALQAQLDPPETAAQDLFEPVEAGHEPASWTKLARFLSGDAVLFPPGLLENLGGGLQLNK